ncbi:MAG: hemolysin family protein [Gemmatimonadota bacterium]
MTRLLWVLGISLAISFLCSILEAVLLSITYPFVQVLKEQNPRAGRYLETLRAEVEEPIAAILTLNTIAHTIGAALAGAIVQDLYGDRWLTAFSVLLTLAVLVLSEIIPKTVGASFWKGLSVPAAYVLWGLVFIMKPVVWTLSIVQNLIKPRTAHPTISRAEIEVLAEIGRREGTLDEAEWQVMTNVMNLDEVSAGQVMTPRTEIVAVPSDATVEEAKSVMLDQGHLRLPVFEGSLDRVVGVLLARDLWQADRAGATEIRGIMRPIQFAPASKPVEELIPEMRQKRTKMMIVVDEFGGTAGLVTLEDLIEEIVGEIQDEHEVDEPIDFVDLEDGRVRVWGGALLDAVNEHLGLSLEDPLNDTLAGHLFGRLARVPRPGDEIQVAGGRFRVVEMVGRRIESVEFEPAPRHETD